MEKILSLSLVTALVCTGALADPLTNPSDRLKAVKEKGWKMSTAPGPKRNFNLDQTAPQKNSRKKSKNGVEMPYPPDRTQLDAQEAEDF